jgi:hypothetical protein
MVVEACLMDREDMMRTGRAERERRCVKEEKGERKRKKDER